MSHPPDAPRGEQPRDDVSRTAGGAGGPGSPAGPSTPIAPTTTDKLAPDVVLVLAVLVSTSFLMMLNETSLAVALPAIMAEFGIAAATGQWALTSVMLTMAIVLPAAGWILERFSTRAVFVTAVGAFLIGTVVAALSPTFAVMLVGRVLQAVGTALVLPLQMTVVMTVVPPQRRGTVMGIIAVVLAVGPALGPSFAGLMLSLGSWHLIFWSLVPLAVLAAVLGGWKLTNVGVRRRSPLDVLSLLLSALAFGGLVYALSSVGVIAAGEEGARVALVAGAVGFVALVVFVWRQVLLTRQRRALLDVRPLTVPTYVIALAAMVLVQVSLLGLVNTLPLYLQGALLTGALVAGLANLPGGILETIFSPVGGMLYDRVGPRPLVIPGLAVMTVMMIVLATVDHATPVWLVVVVFAVYSVGLAFVLTPLMTSALSSLSGELYGHGSAILNTLLQLAGAAGTAAMIAILSAGSEAGGGTPQAVGEGSADAFAATAAVTAGALVVALFLRPARDGGSENLGGRRAREAQQVREALGE